MNEAVWGHDPRPVWLWIGTTIGAGSEGRDDPWEYDAEIEGDWARAQVLRRLVPGMPWIFINGEPLDPGMVREKMGISPDTLQAKIRDHGAVGYTNPKTGDIFEFEIRLENLEEAARFVQANREREKERRKEEEREIKKARMAEMRKDPEAEARRVAAMRAYWAKRTPVENKQGRMVEHLRKAREGLTFIPRPAVPGAIQKLYFNGVETPAREIIKALGHGHHSILAMLLRQGDFRTAQGDLVEIRQLTKDDFYRERAVKANLAIREGLPYTVEPWEKGREPRRTDDYLYNGERMNYDEIARKMHVNKGTLSRLSRTGRIVARDGSYVVDRRPMVYEEKPPLVRFYENYGVIRFMWKGKEYSVFKSTDISRVQKIFDEITGGDYKQHPRIENIIDRA